MAAAGSGAAAPLQGANWCVAEGIDWPNCPVAMDSRLADGIIAAGSKGGAILTAFNIPNDQHVHVIDQLNEWKERQRIAQMEDDLKTGKVREFDVVAPIVFPKIMASPTLRKCQIDCVRAAQAHFVDSDHRSGTIVLPTGCGKSGVIACLPYAIGKRKVLVITPRKTIRGQLKDDLEGRNLAKDESEHVVPFLIKHQLVPEKGMPTVKEIVEGVQLKEGEAKQYQITVSNAAMFGKERKGAKIKHWNAQVAPGACDLVIVDEAHHHPSEVWKGIVQYFAHAKVVFLTATPFRSKGEQVCDPKEIFYKLTFAQAVKDGYIRDIAPVLVEIDDARFYANEETKETARVLAMLRYIQARLKEKDNHHALPAYKKGKVNLPTPRHQAIAVANSTEQANHIAALASKIGLSAHVYYDKLSEKVVAMTPAREKAHDEKGQEITVQRKIAPRVLGQFQRQEFDLIIVMRMLGEGYDFPPISVAAFFFAPKRGPKASQLIGRGVRRMGLQDRSVCDVVWHEHIDEEMQLRFKEMREGNYAACMDDDDVIKGPLSLRNFSGMSLSEICQLSYDEVLGATADLDFLRFIYFDLMPVHGSQAKKKSIAARQKALAKWKKAGDDDEQKEQAVKRLADMGKSIHDNGGQGECFYLAVATCFNAINFQGKQTWTWCEVKADALNALKNLSRATVQSRQLVEVLTGLYDDADFQSHPIDSDANWTLAWQLLVHQLYGADNKYADHLVLQTLREVYSVNITVYSVLDAAHDRPFQSEGYATTIELYHLPEFHYQAVLPAGLPPAAITTASAAPAGPAPVLPAPKRVEGTEYDAEFDPDDMPRKEQKVIKEKSVKKKAAAKRKAEEPPRSAGIMSLDESDEDVVPSMSIISDTEQCHEEDPAPHQAAAAAPKSPAGPPSKKQKK